MQIRLGEEPEMSEKPMQTSTPLTEKDIKAFHDKEKMDYLKKAMKLNTVELESAAEVADSENEKLFQEIINPTPGLIEEIPNSTYPPSEITTEDIYIDDSFQDLAKSIYFPQPSTDDRRDFKIDIAENGMLLFKSPSLTIASVHKKELRKILDKIIEDLDLNLTETLMPTSDIQDTKQKKVILKQLIKRLETDPKKILNDSWKVMIGYRN